MTASKHKRMQPGRTIVGLGCSFTVSHTKTSLFPGVFFLSLAVKRLEPITPTSGSTCILATGAESTATSTHTTAFSCTITPSLLCPTLSLSSALRVDESRR